MILVVILAARTAYSAQSEASSCVNAFKLAATEAHNIYRSMHGVPALSLDQNNQNAQKYAQLLADKNMFKHSPNRIDTGENLFVKFTTEPLTSTQMCARKYGFYPFV